MVRGLFRLSMTTSFVFVETCFIYMPISTDVNSFQEKYFIKVQDSQARQKIYEKFFIKSPLSRSCLLTFPGSAPCLPCCCTSSLRLSVAGCRSRHGTQLPEQSGSQADCHARSSQEPRTAGNTEPCISAGTTVQEQQHIPALLLPILPKLLMIMLMILLMTRAGCCCFDLDFGSEFER